MPNTLLVLKSSAGSGKTYALVRHYLLLCLSSSSPSYYRRILAITFTNAAAAEMKERVISRLKEFAQKEESELLEDDLFMDITRTIQLAPHELRARAGSVLTHIIHHYDLLAICTIDSFTHRLVRSFARELHIDRDFRIELDTDIFLQLVIDRLMAEIGNDAELTRYLERFVLDQFEEGSNWRIANSLLAFSKVLIQEGSAAALDQLSEVPLENFREAVSILNNKRNALVLELKQAAQNVLDALESEGFSAANLKGKERGPINIIRVWARGEIKEPTATVQKLARGEEPWIPQKSDSDLIERIERISSRLSESLARAVDWYNLPFQSYQRCKRLSANLYSIGLIRYLKSYADEVRASENLLLISDFHAHISRIVHDSPAPFIYEKIGERYRHLLFDEFQDTSSLQWKNFIPLIENNLSNGHFNLIVGDGKQAIYRWRNGCAEQFVHLPQLPLDLAGSSVQGLFNSSYQQEILRTNRRSARSIIAFNNELYTRLPDRLGALSDVYEDGSQEPSRDREGYVNVQRIDAENKDERHQLIFTRILEAIHESLASGYALSDIAILTRKGKGEGSKIASFLASQQIPVITKESFLLAHSGLVRWIMHWLGYLNDPNHDHHRIELVLLAKEAFPAHDVRTYSEYFTYQRGRNRADTERFLEDHFPGLQQSLDTSGSAHRLVLQFMQKAGLFPDVYTEFLLDHLTSLERRKNFSLFEILNWWDTMKGRLYIESSDQPDAVKIMTVHKSKGLQFPVVLYPRFRSHVHSSTIWVDPTSELPNIPVALATFTPSAKKTQPFPEMEAEQSQQQLDELNICYVATTRPEERLYLFIEAPVAESLDSAILQLSGVTEAMPTRTFGTPEPRQSGVRKKTDSPVHVIQDTPLTWQTPGIRLHAPSELKEEEPDDPRRMGELVHACLSLIRHREDLENALQFVLRFSTSEMDNLSTELREKVKAILDHPSFAAIFREHDRVINERDIVIEDGSVIRPDRVIQLNNEWWVIDFKTGSPRTHHISQVQEYMEQLSRITTHPVKGFLAYTAEGVLKEVLRK